MKMTYPTTSLSPASLATVTPVRVVASQAHMSAPDGAPGVSAALPVRAGTLGGLLAAV